MAKVKNKRKQTARDADAPAKRQKPAAIITPPPDPNPHSPKTISSIGLFPDDLEIAVDALNTLAANPGVIKTKACKDLRTAVYQFGRACTTGFNAAIDTNLTARISGALADGGYTDARILLAEMRIRKQTPKLGALCRWVRDLDVVSGLAEQLDQSSTSRTAREEELLLVLDAILRLTGPTDYTTEEHAKPTAGPIIPRQAWNLRDSASRRMVYNSVLDHSIFTSLPPDTNSAFRIIESTPGLERKPPNLHPAILHASRDDAIPLSSAPPKTTHHRHPIVPNLHLLKDVLAPSECDQIIAAAETIGFTPDAPIRTEGEESSILAHNFYWIVDTSFSAKLWSRVAQFVPATVDGKKVRGLNRRFRVYRYVPGAEYRAHIDGAWPPSAISPTDTYIYDGSPPTGKQSSLFTFLIYLNDEFDAGETTFFLPSAREGSMNAYSVKPVQGSVAMFPHGETEGSLLHEGTGVRREGDGRASAKYVIRTDVEYDVEAGKE
ncbi:prolyl 4-hydroxylase [Melanomma pulvis-pyrius CBS 109.77]|uniref:Prolyl 4-hydroxylase n=1 Tax=Melanomma pulvis-pyrius CBS 109.77 TaxID=1314802 RepID=A0A6A6XSJ3_9PLEO|nr:prolyl 4-hydroxylase [Melanomma pulvis-pyrius CBS 109.77]